MEEIPKEGHGGHIVLGYRARAEELRCGRRGACGTQMTSAGVGVQQDRDTVVAVVVVVIINAPRTTEAHADTPRIGNARCLKQGDLECKDGALDMSKDRTAMM